MKHLLKYPLLFPLLIPIACGTPSNGNTESQGNDDKTESYPESPVNMSLHMQERVKIVPEASGELYFSVQNVGDINRDGKQDSVVVAFYRNEEDYNKQFNLFFGSDTGYELKYRCPWNGFSDESSLSIMQDGILEIDNEHLVYTFRYHDNELYLEKFKQLDISLPYYQIDFVNDEMEFEQNDDKKRISIPTEKHPDQSDLRYPFEYDFFDKYLYYDDDFFKSLNESNQDENTSNIEKMNTFHTDFIDNDTLFKISSTMENSASYTLTFRKHGLSPQAIQAIERDFSIMVDTFISCHKTSFESIYKSCQSDWEYYNEVDDEGNYINSMGKSNKFFLIEPVFEDGDLISYLFEHSDNNYSDGYFLLIITYNKKTGESFTWNKVMINNDFLDLVKKHLSHDDIEERDFKISYCPPFLDKDSLCMTYQYYEITPARVYGRPSANIPIQEFKPFLTEEGKKFLREGGKKNL